MKTLPSLTIWTAMVVGLGGAGSAASAPSASGPAPASSVDKHAIYRLSGGLALPYPLDNVFRGFADCRRGRHNHQALDIGGVGPNWGVGTPIRAMADSKVTFIGTPESNPRRFGTRLTQADAPSATVVRGSKRLPISGEHDGYGTVHYFTRDYGSSRTGVMITTRATSGRLKGYTLTYMHLAAVHPSLKVGARLKAGQEIGLLGGTAVLESAPHLHLAIKNRRGTYLDVGRLLGIGRTRSSCRRGKRGERSLRAAYSKRADRRMAKLRKARARIADSDVVMPSTCGAWTHTFTVRGSRTYGVRLRVPEAGVGTDPYVQWSVRVDRQSAEKAGSRANKWQPKVQLEDAAERTVYGGYSGSKSDARALRLSRLQSGRRGDYAEVRLNPRKRADRDAAMHVVIGRWRRGRPLPKGAQYELTITRPCSPKPGARPSP